MIQSRKSLAIWAAWLLVLLLAAWAYHPGLTGGFLFDDFVNLDALGASGKVDNIVTFLRYITSGTADPTGRPLSMLSFLIDARDWPADPAPFLRTNLLLHLLNGSLLFLLVRKLGQILGDEASRSSWVALVASGAWLLHPLFVSTTLYIVQREAMLPATFVFAGLLAYCTGRQRFAGTFGERGLGLMFGSLMICTVLATLCKANGVLLPMLVWALEITVLRAVAAIPAAREANRRRAFAVFVVVPSVVVAAYVLRQLAYWTQQAGMRNWTIGQRAMTEPRVLLDYLQLLVVPRSVSTGLYNETYAASQDLFHPASTLPALLLIGALIALAFRVRSRAPAFAAALLFFFAGHLLESSLIPLELYFEHRNYLPAALLAWPLARALLGSRLPTWSKTATAMALLLLLALTTFQRASIWGNSGELAALWASRNPGSSRAQATAAEAELTRGRPDLAVARLGPIWQRRPNDLQIALNYINARCAAGGLGTNDAAQLSKTLAQADIGTLLVRQWLERALGMASGGQCPGLDMPVFRAWLASAQQNRLINTPLAREKSFPPLLALVALEDGKPDEALAYFNRALAGNLQPETAAGQVAELASRGYYHQALSHLNTYESTKADAPLPTGGMRQVHQWVLDRQGYWPRELGLLRQKLNAEIAKENMPERAPDAR